MAAAGERKRGFRVGREAKALFLPHPPIRQKFQSLERRAVRPEQPLPPPDEALLVAHHPADLGFGEKEGGESEVAPDAMRCEARRTGHP